jgi:mono/diheme cytochrome c family protein
MKKYLIIAGCLIAGIIFASCSRRNPGRAYMPDMVYSRAYETYASSDDRLRSSGAHYNARPVEGTIARGDAFPYKFKNDTTGYNQSVTVKNPLDSQAVNMVEAERLYLVNCAICHGTKLNGDGPLYKGGNGPFPAKPATLVGDAKYEAMPAGQMFHSVTFGKGAMGSYASQLNTMQRWMVIAYVKSKQGAKAGTQAAGSAGDSTGTKAKPDSATAMKQG